MNIVFTTPRLHLRQFTEDDAKLLFELDSDPEVLRYLGPIALPDVEAYRNNIRTRYLPYYATYEAFGYWAVVERSSGDFLGWFCLRPGIDSRCAAEAGFQPGDMELGYRFRKAAWGKGYATEGSRELVRVALEQPETVQVVACTLVGNVASRRVMEKVGLKRVGTFAIAGYEQLSYKYALPCAKRERDAAAM